MDAESSRLCQSLTRLAVVAERRFTSPTPWTRAPFTFDSADVKSSFFYAISSHDRVSSLLSLLQNTAVLMTYKSVFTLSFLIRQNRSHAAIYCFPFSRNEAIHFLSEFHLKSWSIVCTRMGHYRSCVYQHFMSVVQVASSRLCQIYLYCSYHSYYCFFLYSFPRCLFQPHLHKN